MKDTYSYLKQDESLCFGRTKDFCKFGSHEKKIILLGDSHFGSLSFDLHSRLKSNYTFLPIIIPGYFHLKESQLISKHTKKIDNNYNILRSDIQKILNNSEDNIIILGGTTSLYFYNKRVSGRSLHWDYQFVDKFSLEYNSKSLENDFLNLIKDLSVNNEIILVYPIPETGVNLQKKKFKNMVRIYNYYYSDFLEQNIEIINFFDSINSSKIHKVYPYKIFCDNDTNLCTTHDEKKILYGKVSYKNLPIIAKRAQNLES